ncbi:MAG: hypothetical protein ONB12_07855 [candidate division KSB1 bacterium]|nr:hypothetical protein [candidate division KSB1 bacterium]
MKTFNAFILFFCTALSAQISVVHQIQPEAAAPGDSVTAWVEFTGVDSLKQVLIIPREYAYDIDEPFPLQRDTTSTKERWIIQVQVPYETPYGAVNLEIRAIDKNDREIVIEEYKDQQFGKAGLMKFEVR